MWRITNGAVCQGMLRDVVLKFTMAIPWQHPAFHHATNSSERPIAQAAKTGDGVRASGILIEKARYRERVDVKCFTVLRLGLSKVRLTCL